MTEPRVNLAEYDNAWYDPGRGKLIRLLWLVINGCVMQAAWLPLSGLRVVLLRMFGAKIGRGVVIKPAVNIKYPWRLDVGDHTWIGEAAWIDNLAQVAIAGHCCISQGVYLCTGNHDWSDPKFGLIVKPITIEGGAWIGAKAIVLPGVTVGEHTILTAGSVASQDLPANRICRGNPATPMREREIHQDERGAANKQN